VHLKFVTERLREEVLDVEAIYVNCWRNYTRFRTLYQILDDLGATIDIHRQSTPHDELVDRLQQHDGPRTVVILLDEVDQLEDPSVIYDLHSLPQFALICIANKEEELFSRVDDRLVSRLRSSEHVRMDKYHDEQLYDILSARTKGLDEDVIADDQLYRVADAAAGDARLAIGILRTAAGKAGREPRAHHRRYSSGRRRGCPSPDQAEEPRFTHTPPARRLRHRPRARPDRAE